MGEPTTLSVQMLGPFAVARDGVPVPAHELASRKGRTLLKLLVARRGAVVPADVIAETLWGERPPADPDANLATLVSRLRSVVGADTIAGDRHGWRLAAGQRVVVDLDEAERLTAEAEARLEDEPSLAVAAAGQALELLGRGPVMADEPDADWAEPARREAERLAGRARRAAWRAALAVGDLGGALEHARGGRRGPARRDGAPGGDAGRRYGPAACSVVGGAYRPRTNGVRRLYAPRCTVIRSHQGQIAVPGSRQ
jgi:DNA-binding SARP family transcriptional activator